MENFKLVIEARTLDDYGDGPDFAEIEINQVFVDRLVALSQVCKLNELRVVSVYASPDKWDKQDELRLSGDSMYVSSEWFWYEVYPKHADYSVETLTVLLSDFIEIAQAGAHVEISEERNCCEIFKWVGGVLFYSSLPEELADRYLSQNEVEDAALEGGDE